MSWRELQDCEWVVLAHYAAHEDRVLVLQVDRVLRGQGVSKGDRIRVALEHWYSVETTPPSWEALGRSKPVPDGIPRLCYKTQVMNPGPAVPVRMVPDVRQPEIYFLPKKAAPALKRNGQVQPARFASAWQQRLDGKPMDLLFRLLQDVNPEISGDALEELNRTRAPAEIEGLLRCVTEPVQEGGGYHRRDLSWKAAGFLMSIGDRSGDVYDRAAALMRQGKFGRQGAEYSLARILATADPARAMKDFEEWIRKGAPPCSVAAVYGLSHIPSDESLDVLLRLLRDARFSGEAASAIRTLLDPASVSARPRVSESRLARLRETARPKLAEALKSPDVADSVKTEIRRLPLMVEPPTVDWNAVAPVLMNPKDETYNGLRSFQGADKLYADLIAVSDSRAVPILATVYSDLREAHGTHAYAFRDAFSHYARICPNSMRNELQKRGKWHVFDPKSPGEGYGYAFFQETESSLRSPSGLAALEEIFSRPGGKEWALAHPDRGKFVQAVQHRLDGSLSDTSPYPGLAELEILWTLDRDACRRYVDAFLNHPGTRRDNSSWLPFLAMALRCGKTERRDELVAGVRKAISGGEHGPEHHHAAILLLSVDGKAYEEYLRILDAAPKVRSIEGWNMRTEGPYAGLLGNLMFEHPSDFFPRLARMLASSDPVERKAGFERLQFCLYWDFGYDPDALPPAREKMAAQAAACFAALESLGETEMRAAVLKMEGVALDGKPGPSWIPALYEAAIREDPGIAGNALSLIGVVVGDSPVFLLHTDPVRRRPALRAFLADRGVALPGPEK